MLAAALRKTLGPVAVERLGPLPGGASRETWSFDAVSPDGTRTQLVLRRDPPGRPGAPGAMSREAEAMGRARAAGLPAPEVLLCADEPEVFQTAGLVMRRAPGESIARRILRDGAFHRARQVLVRQLGEFAAGLHSLEVPEDLPAPDPLADLRAQLREFAAAGQVSGVFEMAIGALETGRPPARPPVMAHGDLRLGNLIVGPDGLRAVIDWELVHAGSPAEDLGWLCVKAWRFGAAAPVAGLGTREELLAAYRAAGGASITVDELRWWEILGTLRWGVLCMAQAQAHLSGAHRSVELAAVGRRVCEQEWDLLLLLAPEAAAEAAALRPRPVGAPRPAPSPHGRPTASELLDAVREFLAEQVMPATTGQLSFHVRVAANALAIVARELELGDWRDPSGAIGQTAAEATGPAPLSAPLSAPPDAPPDARSVAAELAREVAVKLAVANPGYFEAPARP